MKGSTKVFFGSLAVGLFLLFSLTAIGVEAFNGDGSLNMYSPLAVSTDKSYDDISFTIYNNGDACIDELIFTPPATWTGTATFDAASSSTNVIPISVTNEADDGTYMGEVPDNQSLRLQLYPSQMLCPGATATVVIDGLHSPVDPENSEWLILTSDQTNNGPSPNFVRYPIEQHSSCVNVPPVPSPREDCTAIIRVSEATDLKIEYLHIFDDGETNAFTSTAFTGRAWGAWARLDTLLVAGNIAGNADVYIESGQTAGFQPLEDILLGNFAVTGGAVVDAWTMDYSGWNPVNNIAGVLEYGYIEDGSSREYYIDGYGGTLTKMGHTDEARAPIPSNAETGLSGARGTLLNVDNPATGRQINVQLIDENGYDVLDDQIPIWFSNPTGLGHFADPNSPIFTDDSGNAYITLLPYCAYGVESVVLTSPGLDPAVTEFVGINAGAPDSYVVTQGDGVDVIGGDNQLLEVTVYDSCGNVITDAPQTPLVEFGLTNTCGNAFLSENPSGVPSSDEYRPEETSMGIADVYLITDCTLCEHQVDINVAGLGPTTIYLNGIVGPPAKLKVTTDADPDHKITADECVQATVEVTDNCGNLLDIYHDPISGRDQEWESIVRVTVDEPLWSDQWGYVTRITDSDFREESFYDAWVQGKLNNGVGQVEICGCQGLGQFDIIAESDTLEDGVYTVDVENAQPSCIEVNVGDDEMLKCQGQTTVDVAIKDICGNYVVDQTCGNGQASSCVDLLLGGNCPEDAAHLSTDAVCVDLTKTGKAPTTTLYRDREDICCNLEVIPSDAQDCCVSDFPKNLTLCEQSDNSITFIGEPDHIDTDFFKTRKLCEGDPLCIEQIHEAIPDNGIETVSEEVLDVFTVYDACENIVPDYTGSVDVELENPDCVSYIEVDQPLELEGGWCGGRVACEDLTQFGQSKCEETECSWEQTGTVCAGDLQCDLINDLTNCEAVGCDWTIGQGCTDDPNHDDCENLDVNTCDIYTSAGCSFEAVYGCTGEVTSCEPFDKGQCNDVADTVPESCYWVNDCTEEFGGTEGAESIVKKIVIDNCGQPDKQWTNLEEADIMVDKLAFYVNHEEDPNLWVYVYLESEQTPGFQPGEDGLIGKAPMIFGGPTIIEIADVPWWLGFGNEWWSRGWGFDDQREGGVLIRAGDSKDFYVTLVNEGGPPWGFVIPCGTYDIDFLYYQDYTSVDFTNFGSGTPDKNGDSIIDDYSAGGYVRDRCINSDNYQWTPWMPPKGIDSACPFSGPGLHLRRDSRNDDYTFWSWLFNPFPGPTPDYGFGDVYLEDLQFEDGQAWAKFRDLTAEHINVNILDVNPDGEYCGDNYRERELTVDTPEQINFEAQPAKQVVMINHDEGSKEVSCVDDEFDEDTQAFLINLQTTDGFQNPHGKSVDVALDYCLKWPFGTDRIEEMVDWYCEEKYPEQTDLELCERAFLDDDYCFTRDDLEALLKDSEIFGTYLDDVIFGDYFGEEFQQWVDKLFDESVVEFRDYATKELLPSNSQNRQYVTTDSNGQAQVYVTSPSAGYYKITATPEALAADFAYVSFNAGPPSALDIMALPSFGVPADGDQEALLLLRAMDSCGNIVYDPVHDVTISAEGDGDNQVKISQDFEGKNNYDNEVTGDYVPGLFGHTNLAVLDDFPETATITASCTIVDGCRVSNVPTELASDTTEVVFQGAPVKLAITEIIPSDRLPADAECHGEGPCTGTGAWVTVQVQDVNGNRVTGYLGNGFSGDPGDPWGKTDFTFENICVQLKDPEHNAFIPLDGPFGLGGLKFGWSGFWYDGEGPGGWNTYCGDLAFGEGQFYVVYDGYEHNNGGVVGLKVYDEEPYQGQEENENGIPSSLVPTQLDPAIKDNAIIFVAPATHWKAASDKQIVLADGMSAATVTIQLANAYMDIRQAVEGMVQSNLDGSVVSWNGEYDELNPASMVVMTDPLTGSAELKITSTKPGIAEITVFGGDAHICESREKLGYRCDVCNKVYRKYDCYYSDFIDLDPITITVEFIEVADNEVYLHPGWNFISVPFKLDSSADQLNEIFNMSKFELGWAYDPVSGWTSLSGSSSLEPLNGYWIKVNAVDIGTLVYGTPAFPSIPQKPVYVGWNTVGLTWDSPTTMKNALISIDDSYSQVVGWLAAYQKYDFPIANTGGDGAFETGGVNMEPKQGYWIWVTSETDLAGLSAQGAA